MSRNNFGAHLAPMAALWHATSLVITRRLFGGGGSDRRRFVPGRRRQCTAANEPARARETIREEMAGGDAAVPVSLV